MDEILAKMAFHNFRCAPNLGEHPVTPITNIDLPRKQTIDVTKIWFKLLKLERSADNIGREFWARIFWGGGLKAWRLEAEKLACKIR